MSKKLLTMCGIGSFSPMAGGTIASLVSLLILSGINALLFCGLSWRLLIWAIIFIWIYVVSVKAIKKEIREGRYDQIWIVIDEFLGMMVAYLPFFIMDNYDWWWPIISFLLFRFFDIRKPWGIKKIDRANSPSSVILDDILAGVYSFFIFYLISIFL